MRILPILVLCLLTVFLSGQTVYQTDITADVSTGNRTLLNIQNYNTSTTASAALEVKSGNSSNHTVLRMHGDNYTYSWWGKHGQLRTTGDGLIVEATKSGGVGGDIVFVNGVIPGTSSLKKINMKISGNGNVGIGTDDPKEKLEVEGGDIYLKDANSGVIMTSPNGGCWKLTVSDTGQPVFSTISCP